MKSINTYLQRAGYAYLLFVHGGIFATLAQLFLFLRPTPFDRPYVLDLGMYLVPAIFYAWYGIALVSLPFFILLLFAVPPIGGVKHRLFYGSHRLFIFVSLLISQLDHECMRFMGLHLSSNLLKLYGDDIKGMPEAIVEALQTDAGGAYSAVLLLAIPFVFLAVSFWAIPLKYDTIRSVWNPIMLLAMVALTLVLPTLYRTNLFGSKMRQYKVMPPAILVSENIKSAIHSVDNFENIAQDISLVRQQWLKAQTDSGWTFSDPNIPMQKTYSGPKPKADTSWNIVLIVVETFRAKNIQLFNPAEKQVYMPFLEKLSKSGQAAYWTNFIANGQPTVFSFMSIHTAMPPHSTKSVAGEFTTSNIFGFPETLRQHGYQCSFFTSTDPDWDNQRFWLNRWYDYVFYEPTFRKNDRFVFKQAAKYLKEKGGKGRPFLSTIFTIANHLPFESPEAEFNQYGGGDLQMKIGNTLRYTDDVLREFFESIGSEPWFDKTIFIITGDHAYDLGDRGVSTGHTNCRHETDWVPLVMVSSHPLQPKGEQATVASQIDIAPTVFDLLQLTADNAFWGHSLFKVDPKNAYSFNFKMGNMGVETPLFSAFFPLNEAPYLYEATDKLQKTNIVGENGEICCQLHALAKSHSRVVDYLIEQNKAFPAKIN